jgi:hypothetical protein
VAAQAGGGFLNVTKQNGYGGHRDTLCQLIPFAATNPGNRSTVLRSLTSRLNSCGSSRGSRSLPGLRYRHRNERLAAIGALARFAGEHSPIHIEWSGQIRMIVASSETVIDHRGQNALASAMREIPFSIGRRRTDLGARQDHGVDEKDFEHGVGLLIEGRPD